MNKIDTTRTINEYCHKYCHYITTADTIDTTRGTSEKMIVSQKLSNEFANLLV